MYSYLHDIRLTGGLVVLLLAGCKGVPTRGERAAREQAEAVASLFRPDGRQPVLPVLSTNAGLETFLSYAMLNQPQVQAAYDAWMASVERITVARSLPDPRLTFESDIAEAVMTVMPGLMQEFPGPGKLRRRADLASAESQAHYFAFETAVLQAAFALKRPYYQLWFLEEKMRIYGKMLQLLGELERTARAQSEAGRVTLQDVYRAQIEQDRLHTEISNLEDSRHPLQARFKAALGMTYEQPDPPFPSRFESSPADVNADNVLQVAYLRNPRLKAMEAEVRLAQAALALAFKARVPDFSLGVMTDLKASPVMVRPQASMSLPIWRDKIAAEIAAAQADKRAAEARLSQEQISLAVSFAESTFHYREISRILALLQERLIPKARQSLEIARAGYLGGRIDFFNLINAQRMLLDFQLDEIEQRTERELVLAEISLLILGVPPPKAPVLPSAATGDPAARTRSGSGR